MWEHVWLAVMLRMCMYAACMPVRVSIDMGIQMHTLSVVNSGPLFTLIPCKDFINTCTNKLFPVKLCFCKNNKRRIDHVKTS